MFGEENNLKDTTEESLKDSSPTSVSYTENTLTIGSYTKTSKLITALYMVTDILSEGEPIRSKLRLLSISILSDIHTVSKKPALVFEIERKVDEILSLLSISSSIGMISQMNAGILQREFIELKKALKDYSDSTSKWLAGILLSKKEDTNSNSDSSLQTSSNISKNTYDTKRHSLTNNVLKKNIKDTGATLKDIKIEKHKRQEEILKIVRENNTGLTISDIRSKGSILITTCAEKTLQRELVSMLKDNVLKKEGEKRWSKYFLA